VKFLPSVEIETCTLEKFNSSLPHNRDLGGNYSRSAKSPTHSKAHQNGIKTTTWHNDHGPILRARVETKSLKDPKTCLISKRTILYKEPYKWQIWLIHPHGGTPYIQNPNVLLYKHTHINPLVWDSCTSNSILFIPHSYTDLNNGVLTLLQVHFP
jgi:hypothetical protein